MAPLLTDDRWLRELWDEVRPVARAKVEALGEAIAGGDQTTATRLAHDLAGSLGSYGHGDASAAAAELERSLLEAPTVDAVAASPLLERIRLAVT